MEQLSSEQSKKTTEKAIGAVEDLISEGLDDVAVEKFESDQRDGKDKSGLIYEKAWFKTLLGLLVLNVALSGYLRLTEKQVPKASFASLETGQTPNNQQIAMDVYMDELSLILSDNSLNEAERIQSLQQLQPVGVALPGEQLYPNETMLVENN